MCRRNVHPSTALLRRRSLEEVGGFDESIQMCDDWDLWLRLAERYGCLHLPQKLATVREHQRNTSRVALDRWTRNSRLAIEKALARRPDMYGHARRGVLSRHHFWAGFYAYRRLQMSEARTRLLRSLSHRPSIRTLKYLLTSMLGAGLVRRIRALTGLGAG